MDHASALRVAYVGNFKPEHSTENHVRIALESLGHDVEPLQEDDPATWDPNSGLALAASFDIDLVLWTRTWHLPEFDQAARLDQLAEQFVPVVGFHLDRWWGLDREHQVVDEPFFRCPLVVTADGGHDQAWLDAGVNHLWMPPAVLGAEARLGTPSDQYRKPLAFVGSWSGYHEQWQHRRDLVGWCGRRYGRNFGLWPRAGRQVRGDELRDLYASIDLAVGDSCLVPDPDGTPVARYWSDRIPETLGRGALLVHPWVDGLEEQFDGLLPTWEAGQWRELGHLIDSWLGAPSEVRRARADALRAIVLERHTYERRMADLIAHVDALGWIQ